MRRLVLVVLVSAVTLGLLAAAIYAAGDRATVVPPPEAVAVGLLRQLHAHRYVRTGQFLSASARQTWSPDRLETWWRHLESEIGPIEHLQGRSHVMRETAAQGIVQVRGKRRSAEIEIPLRWERGLWAVADLPRRAATNPKITRTRVKRGVRSVATGAGTLLGRGNA